MKITDNSDELSFHQLTSKSALLVVPLFQRPYIWANKQLDRMISEIESIVENVDESRFLGAIIAVTRPVNPSQPTPYEIVDGQQRLTTMYLFLLAAAQVAAREGHSEFARGLISTNLIVDWAQEIPSNTKLQPSISDRAQFAKIFDIVSKTGELSDWLPIKVKVPHKAGQDTGPLLRQFRRIQSFLRKRVEQDGFQSLEQVVEAARNNLMFVFILLKDPGAATTVFEGLNDPGVPISVGDLVKNEVFARIGYDEPQAQVLHDNKWLPFRGKFGDDFDNYFFPYCIVFRTNTSRTEMFGELRKLWKELSAEEIIERLDEYSSAYLALHGNQLELATYGKEVREKILKLVALKQPSSTFPFLLRLLRELEIGGIAKKDVIACLETIESFLVRRAICGIEPTGLLGLFRTMWSSTNGHPNADNVAETILKRLTVEWPSDTRFTEAIQTRPLYGSSIARFAILEYDLSLGGDDVGDSDWSIEHVMPVSYCDEWSDVMDQKKHGKLKNLWANLIPLSKAMNSDVDQKGFAIKKTKFASDSMFSSARAIGQEYESWDESVIENRSIMLSEWAISRWPRSQ